MIEKGLGGGIGRVEWMVGEGGGDMEAGLSQAYPFSMLL